ncbi:MAG TPA: PEP-CTERM sorting domain-containing protein [Fimbriimonadaceae bacterium]|nr:PEP-CTERM sorting domain-containing protein [Fimbriimonadaceae bacterium]
MRVLVFSLTLMSSNAFGSWQFLSPDPYASDREINGFTSVSTNGSVIGGSSGRYGFRYTMGSGYQLVDSVGEGLRTHILALSANGKIATGNALDGTSRRASRWIGNSIYLMGKNSVRDHADAVASSADGKHAVGRVWYDEFEDSRLPAYWDSEGNLTVLPLPDEPDVYNAQAFGVTDDGNTITVQSSNLIPYLYRRDSGYQRLEGFLSGSIKISGDGQHIYGYGGLNSYYDFQLVRWNALGQMEVLGKFPGEEQTHLSALSRNGQFITGSARTPGRRNIPFLWTEAGGFVNIAEMLIADGNDLNGYDLNYATAISNDGRTIVGWGSRNGAWRPWMAVNSVPEPGTLAALTLGLGAIFLKSRRKP